MRIGFEDSKAVIKFQKENIRSISDAYVELQTEMKITTSGSYTDAVGNVAVYSQSHTGAPTIRATASPDLVQAAVASLTDNYYKRVQLANVSYAENRIAGENPIEVADLGPVTP